MARARVGAIMARDKSARPFCGGDDERDEGARPDCARVANSIMSSGRGMKNDLAAPIDGSERQSISAREPPIVRGRCSIFTRHHSAREPNELAPRRDGRSRAPALVSRPIHSFGCSSVRSERGYWAAERA